MILLCRQLLPLPNCRPLSCAAPAAVIARAGHGDLDPNYPFRRGLERSHLRTGHYFTSYIRQRHVAGLKNDMALKA
jgi:hypothetical protein